MVRDASSSWRRRVALILAAACGASALVMGTSGAAAAAPGDGTPCASNVTGISEFVPVTGMDLPATGLGAGTPLPTSFDRTAEVQQGFDRVGYCLELVGPQGSQWVWTAMDAFTTDARRLDPPTTAGEVTRQRVSGLDVASNVSGVAPLRNGDGYLEFWPSEYASSRLGQISGASDSVFDAEDTPRAGTHGSFQVHAVSSDPFAGPAPRTVLSVSGYNVAPGNALSLGIGTQTSANPDWTFAGNAASFTTRRLTVFARPAALALTEAPQDGQLFPRGADDRAPVRIAGRALDSSVTSVRARLSSGTQQTDFTATVGPDRTFTVTPQLQAGLKDYRIELTAVRTTGERPVARWERLVAGDVYVIQGQSNGEAVAYNGSSSLERSPWIRTYGSQTADPVFSGAERTWDVAQGDTGQIPGFVGQWGIRMASRLIAQHGVPVAVFNGAHAGQPIGFFQRDDANPSRIDSNYGRLLQRLTGAEVRDRVRAVLWYQGEQEFADAATHVAGFTSLLADWRSDLGSAARPTEYYVWQVRTTGCSDVSNVAVRDAQRRLADTHDVTVLSTSGINAHDGCHYAYAGGYREIGDQAAAVVGRDLLGGTTTGVSAPNPASASISGTGRTSIVVKMRPGAEGTETLSVDAGAAADFRVTGTSVTGVTARPGELVLTLAGSAPSGATVAYHGHVGSGPRVLSPGGVGILAFSIPISEVAVAATAAPSGVTAGATTTVTTTVTNNTAATISGVSVAATLPEGWTANPASVNLPPLSAGASASAAFTLSTPRSAVGVQTLPVRTTFTTPSGTSTATSTVSITVRSDVNLAQGKQASQSSEWSAAQTAGRAVDGNTRGVFSEGSVTHTAEAGQSDPWWRVDLGSPQTIGEIEIWNRTDCCTDRLSGYRIEALDTAGAVVWSRAMSGFPDPRQTVDTGGVTARFVKISLSGAARVLSLAEVVVHPGKQNLAQGRPATQSSTYADANGAAAAGRAVDGNTDGVYAAGSVSHTTQQSDPWWQVDLGSDRAISDITIWNRTDFEPGRLSGYRVEVLNTAGAVVWSSTQAGHPLPSETLATGNVSGRFVKVTVPGTGRILSLAEVLVH